MVTGMIKRTLVGLLLTIAIVSCNGKPEGPLVVKAICKVNPESGSTLTNFVFDATESFIISDEENPVVVRYDWQSNGIWDNEYTTSTKVKHRFLIPGTYHVIIEARNMAGSRDTSRIIVLVEQGYSPPIAFLSIYPDSANLFAAFNFNSSRSYDDEDSSNTLAFRWDFNGDGIWDTDFGSESTIQHHFSIPGQFNPGVEVKDPTGRSAVSKTKLIVNLLNDSILPEYVVDSGLLTVSEVIQFDASASRFLDHPEKKLTYSWDIFNDNIWEATNLTIPYFKTVIKKEGKVKVKLRVGDDRGLYMETLKLIEILPANSPPVPVLILGNRIGNLQSNFFLNSYGTHDAETSIMDLKYQWDVNDDGVWDDQFNDQLEISCHFNQIGEHLIRLKVTDTHNDSAIAVDTVFVFGGHHETDILIDKRRYPRDYYGIVKIGNLWWMQENLKIEIEPGDKPAALIRMCYDGKQTRCARYGGLYNYSAVQYPFGGICPKDWRLPTKAEFEEMVALEAPKSITQLLLGGSSELHILLGGYISLGQKSIGFGNVTHLWLSDISGYGLPSAWYIDKAINENRPVTVSQTYGFSVRCVKSIQ
jgi:uncharacterized protein (TIGR02145 family)